MEYNFSGLQKVEDKGKFNFEGLKPIEPAKSIPKPYERMDVPAATQLNQLAPLGLAPEIEPEQRKGMRGGATRGWKPEGLYDKPEDFDTVSGAITQFSKNFLSTASAGLPEFVEGKMGIAEKPQGEMEEIAAGLGNLAGFVVGLPGKITASVTKQILKQYPQLITTGSEGVFKRIAKNLATEAPALGTGFAASGLGKAASQDNLEDVLNTLRDEFTSGLGVGAVFGTTRGIFPSSRIARIATGMTLLDTLQGTSPWDERSLKQKVFDYGIDLWFLWKGGTSPASIERAIRDRLHETFKEGKPLPKELLQVFKKRKWADDLLVLDELEKSMREKEAGEGIEETANERRKDFVTRKKVSEMSNEELQKELYTDQLTKLKNRRAYEDFDKKPVQASIDVDSLKAINDKFGHEAGDILIQKVGDALRSDNTIHISGDEFIVQGETASEVNGIIKKAQKYLKENPIEFIDSEGNAHSVTGSFSYGVGKTLKVAENNMYKNKVERSEKGLRSPRGEMPKDTLVPTKGEEAPSKVPPERPEMPLKDTLSEGVGIKLKPKIETKGVKPSSKPEAIKTEYPEGIVEPQKAEKVPQIKPDEAVGGDLIEEAKKYKTADEFVEMSNKIKEEDNIKSLIKPDKKYGLRGERSLGEILKENLDDNEIKSLVAEGKIPKNWRKIKTKKYKIGDEVPLSEKFSKGMPTGETSSGTSSVGVNINNLESAIKDAKNYKETGSRTYILESENAYTGEDFNPITGTREAILENPIVVGIIEPDGTFIGSKYDAELDGYVALHPTETLTKSQLTDIWNEAHKGKADITYEEFAKQYEDAFKRGDKYRPDQAGFNIYAEKMAELADKYPEYLERFEREVERKVIKEAPPKTEGKAKTLKPPKAPVSTKVEKGAKGKQKPITTTKSNVDKLVSQWEADIESIPKRNTKQRRNRVQYYLNKSSSLSELEREAAKRLPYNLSGQRIPEKPKAQSKPTKPSKPSIPVEKAEKSWKEVRSRCRGISSKRSSPPISHRLSRACW